MFRLNPINEIKNVTSVISIVCNLFILTNKIYKILSFHNIIIPNSQLLEYNLTGNTSRPTVCITQTKKSLKILLVS